MYKKGYAEIKNVNTKKFWDTSFAKELSFQEQDEMTKRKIDKLVSFIPKENIKLLDLGFGQGYIEERLQHKNILTQTTGIDISASAVKRAKKKFKGEFLEGDVLRAKKILKGKKFDVITAIELIEHISPKDIFTFFKDIRTLLNPEGLLLISTPMNEGLQDSQDNPSGHVRDYRVATLKKELELSGFEVTEVSLYIAFPKNYAVKNFIAKIFPNRWKANNIVIKARRV
ncbi:MAG: class I SAM-dependent methyltransferase [Candidatus Levyibacteriota bacterium]